MTKSHILGLTLAVFCCILATCSQARRISHRHDVVGPPEGAALDTSGWRPVVDSGRPKLEQVALAPTGYDGDSDLVPPPRRNPSLKKNRPHKGAVASETRSSSAFTILPPDASSKRPVRFPDDKRRPLRRHRPAGVHLRPYLAQAESSVQHVRFRPSPPAPDNIWSEPTEPSVGYFTPQHYNDQGPLHLAIAPHEQHQQQLVSTQQVFGNPALFNLEQVRRPQDNAYLEPSVHENEVIQGVQLTHQEAPKYIINDHSSQPPRRRRPRPPPTEETPYIDQELHRSPALHEAPAWATEPSVRPRRPQPTPEEVWRHPEVQQEEEEEEERRPVTRPPAPVQEELGDDLERPVVFKMRPRKPIASPPTEKLASHQFHEERPRPQEERQRPQEERPRPQEERQRPQEERPRPQEERQRPQEERPVRQRRPRPTPAPVVQEDLEQEVSSPRPQAEEERPLKRRRPRPPQGEAGQRRRRPKPRPQPVAAAPEEEEEQQQHPQPEQEDRQAHRRPIENWPTKPVTTTEPEIPQDNYPEVQQETYPAAEIPEGNYPAVDAFPSPHLEKQHLFQKQQEQHHHQQQHQEQEHEIYPEEEQVVVEEIPHQQPSNSEEVFEQHPIPEEVDHQEPNEVTSTESLFSIPPKRKRPEITTTETVMTTTVSSTTSQPSSTTSSISQRLRNKLNQTRPRFSLNNIKERLTQQQMDQQKTEEMAANTEPTKSRFRLGASTTMEPPTTERSTFRPSMSRFTRPPFNSRYRSTTGAPAVATTTEHLATRRANPDVYSQNKERRPNLRRRTTSTTEAPVVTTTEEMEEQPSDVERITEEIFEATTMVPVSSTTPEDNSYSRRVTDLTSSATAFKPLSFFSAVPADGKHASQLRFTMATEDPILPIEAFFPAFTSRPAKPHGE